MAVDVGAWAIEHGEADPDGRRSSGAGGWRWRVLGPLASVPVPVRRIEVSAVADRAVTAAAPTALERWRAAGGVAELVKAGEVAPWT
jgi:hypothetical protein